MLQVFHTRVLGVALALCWPFLLSMLMPAAVRAQENAPVASPFGPGWDPNGPPPTEPETSGPGITSAAVTASGPADIEEFHPPHVAASDAYTAVVLSVHIDAASTTPVLGKSSVVAKSEDGTLTPVFAICLPTAAAPVTVFHGAGGTLAHWHVNAGGVRYDCGGRNARLAYELGEGGMRIQTTGAWNGPMLLIMRTPASAIRHVDVAGLGVDVNPGGPPKTDRDKKS